MTTTKKSSQAELAIVDKEQEAAMITLSPIPREFLDRMQKFQKQVDRKPTQTVQETMGGQTFLQLPITYVEHLLKKLYFGLYQIEVVSYGMLVNEITVHVRLRVYHPILGQWMAYDGLAAIPVSMDSGSKVSEFMMKKKTKALNLNLPAAYALAVKNAAKKIGKVFGGDLNRRYEDDYVPFPIQEPLNE